MAVDTFGIEKEFLRDLLEEVRDGGARLPEFQRGWVWPEGNIASLLASVSQGYPVGTVMMLRTGGEARFRQRLVEGVEEPKRRQADRLILDGQQRLTSLFQALMLRRAIETVDARRKPTAGWFYIDIYKALDPQVDREEAIRFIPRDRIVRNFRNEVVEDYSTPAREYEGGLFPLSQVFEPFEWQMGFQEFWSFERERMLTWNQFFQDVVQRFGTYQVPVIELGAQTPKEAVCQVFEKVNTGGVTLTVFELLTATYAADEFELRRDWEKRRSLWKSDAYRVLSDVQNTDFLQAVTLLATYTRRQEFIAVNGEDERAPRIGCKRSDILNLSLDDYQRFAPAVVEGLLAAARFLHEQYLYDTKFLPYGSQLIPLAAVLALAGKSAESASAKERIARWYWCGVFGELYGGTTETRFSRDLPDVYEWINGGPVEPRTVTESQFAAGRLLTLRTRGSAAYKGIYALLLREGARDWRTGTSSTVHDYFEQAVDIHHIFPRDWASKQSIPASRYDSIINKTPLSATTNRVVGGNAPSSYLARLEERWSLDAAKLDGYIATHLIEPDLLRSDDFDAFFEARQRALLTHVSAAMGKPVTGDVGHPVDSGDPDEGFDD